MSTRRALAGALALTLLRPPVSANASDPVHAEPAPVARAEGMVDVAPELRKLALPLPPALLTALRTSDWSAAYAGLKAMDVSGLVGPQRADHAFLVVWTAVRTGKAAEAAPYLSLIDEGSAPVAWRALIRAEVTRAQGDNLGAMTALDAVPEGSALATRALAQRAELLIALGRSSEGVAIYQSLIDKPDPAEGASFALLAMAKRKGVGSDASYALLRRLWTWYPNHAESREAERLLASSYATRLPTPAESIRRAERRQAASSWSDALSLTEGLTDKVTPGTEDACRLAYVRGRSYYKQNSLTNALTAFGDAGRACAKVPGDYGDKILYLGGEALFRKGQYTLAADSYAAILALYPRSSMADDALTRGGIALEQLGNVEGARTLWRRALDERADGDTVPEATFKLAFSLYDAGHTDDARAVALKLSALPQGVDEVSVLGGRYWAARWLAYPDVKHPNVLGAPDAVATAVREWTDLMRSAPYGWYAALAYSRLKELAPEVAASVTRPARDAGTVPWTVRESFLHGGGGDALALARLGLLKDAQAVWGDVDDDLLPDEMAWWTELRVALDDWLFAHDAMVRWLRTHPLGTLGMHEAQIVQVAYPSRYWAEIKTATGPYTWEPRMFHALVREESLFNKDVKSPAGALGLSQVMPATGRTVAGWLGLSFSTNDLLVPEKNLKIGAKYLDTVLHQQGNDPCLAFASYNAGPQRVDEWIAKRGNLPLDEFVERIPFRETRGYVKRVSSTWQTYRYAQDLDSTPFVDLSAFNHVVRPVVPAAPDGGTQ